MQNKSKKHLPRLAVAAIIIAAALTLTDLLNAVAFSYTYGTPFGASLWLMVRELLISLPVAMLIHPAFSHVHRRFAGR